MGEIISNPKALDQLNSKIGTDVVSEANITANTADGWALDAGKVYKHRNGLITIDLVVYPKVDKTINTWNIVTIATIPEGYRPSVETNAPLLFEKGPPTSGFYTIINAAIKTNGNVELQTRYTSLSLIGNGTFMRPIIYCYM